MATAFALLTLRVTLCEEPAKANPPFANKPKIEADVANDIVFEAAVPLDPRREDWLRSELLSGRSEVWARMQAERSLAQRVSELQIQCQLTTDQSTKLMLAGRGDIAKYFRDMEDLYSELKPAATEEITSRRDLSSFLVKPEIQAKLMPLKNRWRSGLHGAGSLYQGVVKQMLTSDQIDKIVLQLQQRDQLRLTERMMTFIVNVEKSMPLTSAQRNKLLLKLESIHAKDVASQKSVEVLAQAQLINRIVMEELNQSPEKDYRHAPMIAAMKLRQVDLEEFLDAEQVKTMIALQRHWRLNVPLLNSLEESK